jgi:hypothetical protein
VAKPSSFDWSEWDKQSIIDMVYMAKDRVVNQPLTIAEFDKRLNNHIKNWLPIRSRRSCEEKVDTNFLWVGGMYYTDYDKDRKKSIELSLCYRKGDTTINLTHRRFKGTCGRIADVLLHEIIHMQQARKRKFKNLPGYSSTAESTKQRQEQEYLGDPDEIDAYAFNMACELNEKFNGDLSQIVSYFDEPQKGKRRYYNTWRMYLKAFDWDSDHRIIRRLKKRCIYYLSRSQISRPIQPGYWIKR